MMMSKTNQRLIFTLALAIGMAGCATDPAKQKQKESQARAEAQIDEANAFLEVGLLDSALAAFGLALEDNPQMTDAHLGMGHIYRQHENFGLAEKSYKRAADTDPTNFDAHYYLGLMRQLGGKIEAAITAYLQALAIAPDNMAANRDLASAYLQNQSTYQALPYALRATEINSEDQNAWYTLATTYSLLGQYENAVEAYRQAAELGELADPVMLGLADAHLKLGNYQRAVNVLRTYMRSSNDPASTAHERLGYAFFKLKRFEEALEKYREALELNDQDTAAINGAGACLMTLYIQNDRDNFALRDEAVRLWRQSIQLKPDQPRIIDLLARYGRI